MAERPILFQGNMVRALLDGTKTQTRRVMKPQPPQHTVAVGRWQDPPGYDAAWWAFVREGAVQKDHPFGGAEIHGDPWRCPYGVPGDRLWVRETWTTHAFLDDTPPRDLTTRSLHYQADGVIKTGKLRPSIHMPRWASRITLEVVGVRVERLQEISEADAIAEGCTNSLHLPGGRFANENYEHLWWQINGDGSWEANPWVWVVEFRRVMP